jgi:hypothetical protein
MFTALESRYHERLRNMPQPKQGRHPALLGISNLGIMAGLTPETIHSDLARVTSNFPMPVKEIQAAVSKAATEHSAGNSTYRPPPHKPLIKDGQAALNRIIAQGTLSDDADLFEISPIRLNVSPEQDPLTLLTVLFKPNELVFIGDRLEPGVVGQNIRSAAEWGKFFLNGGKAGPHIIINPFTGLSAPKKDGQGNTFRGDGNILTYRHCLVEFDNLSREDQIRFWSATPLPVLALIDSGGKSIHGWLDVQKLSNVSTAADWDREIKMNLYQQIFNVLGVDRATCNPSRLSRLPGFFRSEKNKFQRLLWLSPVGRRVKG